MVINGLLGTTYLFNVSLSVNSYCAGDTSSGYVRLETNESTCASDMPITCHRRISDGLKHFGIVNDLPVG